MTIVIAAVAVLLALAMAGAWAVQRASGNSGWVDAIWSFSTGAAGVVLALASGGPPVRRVVIAVLIAAWALRLGGHIALRSRGAGDDPRYADLQRQWGADFYRRLFWFLQIQAACAFVLACAVWLAARNPVPALRALDILGAALLVVSVAGEAVADAQLRAYKADPANRGGVCDRGLWGWSRHPNYFFEWLVWIAVALFAVGPDALGWLAFAAPVLMYWLLVYASGVPPLEAHMARSRPAAWAAYAARTSVFFPRPPKAAQ
jgi:steroid 5-alpha reductase family enzyme